MFVGAAKLRRGADAASRRRPSPAGRAAKRRRGAGRGGGHVARMACPLRWHGLITKREYTRLTLDRELRWAACEGGPLASVPHQHARGGPWATCGGLGPTRAPHWPPYKAFSSAHRRASGGVGRPSLVDFKENER